VIKAEFSASLSSLQWSRNLSMLIYCSRNIWYY